MNGGLESALMPKVARPVVQAKAGTHFFRPGDTTRESGWIPAFAGMTARRRSAISENVAGQELPRPADVQLVHLLLVLGQRRERFGEVDDADRGVVEHLA